MWSHTACGIETAYKRLHSHLRQGHMWSHTACGIETTPLMRRPTFASMSHVISYRLRYWNGHWRYSIRSSDMSHMWSHTACGIETTPLMRRPTVASKSHVISYRLRYWNLHLMGLYLLHLRVTCDLIPLAVLKRQCIWLTSLFFLVTCDLIPLAVLKPTSVFILFCLLGGHMWSHTACGIETYSF